MNTINITTELCQEDRKRIDELIGSISLLAGVIGSTLLKTERNAIKANDPQVAETNSAADENPATAPIIEEPKAEEAPAPAPAAEPAPIVISLPEFQKAVTLAVSKGPEAKTAVKTLINKYAASVSEVPEDKRAEVVAELANI